MVFVDKDIKCEFCRTTDKVHNYPYNRKICEGLCIKAWHDGVGIGRHEASCIIKDKLVDMGIVSHEDANDIVREAK